MTVYFIGDLHLNHKNIIKYCNRPFRTVGEMNKVLIRNWNSTISKKDKVYYLGDLLFKKKGITYYVDGKPIPIKHRTKNWVESNLNGEIVFILGNHDKKGGGVTYHEKLLLEFGEYGFLLIHDPYYIPSWWKDWTIHGHTHNNHPKEYPLINRKKKTINVSVELLDYKPISLEGIIDLIEKR